MLASLTAVFVIVLLMLLIALFVAAEFATVYSRRTKVSQMAGMKDSAARALLPFLEDPRQLARYVTASQIGISLCSLLLGAYIQSALAGELEQPLTSVLAAAGISVDSGAAANAAQALSALLVLIAITAFVVIFGELFPKSLALQYAEEVATALVWPMRVVLFVFAAPIWLFERVSDGVLRLFGHSRSDAAARLHSAAEIEVLVTESHEGGLLDDNERRLLRNALRMRELTARQVMVHRTRVTAAPLAAGVEGAMQIALDEGFSRIPIYRDSLDDVLGFVHIKDIFRLHVQKQNDLNLIMRQPLFVPETLAVGDVWEQLNAQSQYMAVVFDEFGGTAGLITLEDLIEEIFGELQDEFDDEMATIARDKDGRIYLRGDLLVDDVNEYLELDLPTEPADTLSGLVFSRLGRPPVVGDQVTFGKVVIRIETMTDLAVGEVSLFPPDRDDESPFSEWDVEDHE